MAVFISPIGNSEFLDSSGNPLSGGLLYTYAAGSSTPLATYTDNTGNTAQANPVVLNSRGEPDNPIWITGGRTYKFILKTAAGVTIWTIDNISGINDASNSASQWISSGVTPTYVSATTFTLAGDQTTAFHVNRRIKSTASAGTIYSRISATAYTTSTLVTVVNDSAVLDSGLSSVELSLLTSTNPSYAGSTATPFYVSAATQTGQAANLSQLITQVGVTTVNGTPPLHLNDIVNGDFRIAQAVTSFAAPANGAYDLDGWLNENNTTAAFTVARVAGSTAGRLARRVTVTTADTAIAVADIVSDRTIIEGYNIEKYVGKTFTIAFRKSVPVAGIHCVALRNDGSDRSYVAEINFPTANVWQDCSFTVTGGLPTAGTWNYTTGVGLRIDFTHMCGTDRQTATTNAWVTGNFFSTANQVNDCATVGNVWALEKATMNLGTVAAVGETSIEQELIRCKRLRPAWYAASASTSAWFAAGSSVSTTQSLITFPLDVEARTAPTGIFMSSGGNWHVSDTAGSPIPCSVTPTFYSSSRRAVTLLCTVAGGLTAGAGSNFSAGTAGAFFYATGSEL